MLSPTTRRIRNFTRFLPGASLAVIGSLAAISGGGVLAAFGTDGSLASGPHLLSTPASAIVSPVASIKNTSGVTTVTGQPTVRISTSPVQGTAAVFVGIGPSADVDRYLTGVATEKVTNLNADSSSHSTIRHGEGANPQPPAKQRFWVAQASSRQTAEVNWKLHDGQYQVVVMNANGQRGFATTSTVGITIPNIARDALAGLLLGLLIAAGGTALLLRAARRPRDGSPSPATSAGAAAAA
jgi:hypothetical protein